MTHAPSDAAQSARAQSLDLLNQHLAAAVVLQDRMQRSPRHVLGPDFIMVDDLCDRVAHLMETCAGEIAGRVADLGGVPHWPVQLTCPLPIRVADLPDVIMDAAPLAADPGPLDAFAQSVLDAAAVAGAYGDSTTADLLAQIWRDVDRHLWMKVKLSTLRALSH